LIPLKVGTKVHAL
jgi:Asp-tRNA(Asn)/Glu-tRNA(Gln) amidotransferase A subunit family amidase